MQRLNIVDSVYVYEYFTTYDKMSEPGLYMFDLDDTLITTKSGAKFPTDARDWKWKYDCVPTMLAELATNNLIIIITNQSGISKGTTTINIIIEKIQSIAAALKTIPFSVYIATGNDKYRKPQIGIFDMIAGKIELPKQYYYIGDAAGRVATNISKKDFSCSDRKFAHNIRAQFQTPEEFFLCSNPMRYIMEPDPAKIYKQILGNKMTHIDIYDGLEIIISVGMPASGKSTFAARTQFRKYIRISADDLKSVRKCIIAAENALARGVSVIIDNTNPGKSARAPFIEIAKKYEARAHIIEFTTSRECAEQLNALRVYNGGVIIPTIAYSIYMKHYEKPELSEGANLISCVEFVPDFDDRSLAQFLRYS